MRAEINHRPAAVDIKGELLMLLHISCRINNVRVMDEVCDGVPSLPLSKHSPTRLALWCCGQRADVDAGPPALSSSCIRRQSDVKPLEACLLF